MAAVRLPFSTARLRQPPLAGQEDLQDEKQRWKGIQNMQAAPVTAVTVVAKGTDFAKLSTRHHDSELVTLGEYGRKDGYTTLDAAVAAMKNLTKGDARKGVAIFEKGDRFFGQRVLEKIADARTTSGLRGAYLDIEDDSNVRLMPFDQHPRLRAVVDGSKVVYSKWA